MSAPFQGGRTARKPGRIERAVQRQVAAAARTAAICGGGLAVSGVADVAMHSAYPTLLVLGGAGLYAGQRLYEAYGWHRAGGRAAMRRRRKYQGTASRQEMSKHLSAGAVRARVKVTRPSAAGTRGLPPSEAGVLIGTAGRPPRRLYGTPEDFYVIYGPQRSGKTGWMAGAVIDAPGACLTASTRVDMWAHTSIPRSRRGPVYVLNPTGDGGILTNFAWSPLTGCGTGAGATTAAGYLMAAAPKDATGKDGWWDAQGAVLLRLMMHAGALAGAPMTLVRRWVNDPASAEPMSILSGPRAAPGWAHELAGLTASNGGEYLSSVSRSADTAIAWLSDPAMQAIACPREALDVRELLTEGGTVYLIGTDRPHNSLSPYFALFAAHWFDTAKLIGAASPGSRCDPPVTMVIDEPALTCPVPLDAWSAEAGGHGVTLITGFQSRSQMAARWGEHGARTIWNNATVTLIYGGFKDDTDLEAFSRACGDHDTWDHVHGPGGEKTRAPRQARLFPPERIRTLPEGQALLLHRRTRPLIAAVAPVWERPGYERATAPGTPIHVPEPQPAIGAPHPPIALPAPAVPAGAFVLPSEEDEWQPAPSSASTPN